MIIESGMSENIKKCLIYCAMRKKFEQLTLRMKYGREGRASSTLLRRTCMTIIVLTGRQTEGIYYKIRQISE